ncbi:Gfo/Idh/MocA family oxidoreductase [Bacillus sp. WMMC1349]|uniref:Gfo/Idh/MocA family protein n=1 Tax=Bacillus sp. WMMC1349 TaxID=2736254 RepID=UPI001557E585|nr:Gfo/Idh/MocA family oxidoreductase [Bacillus sp. WMMC1349]NPC91340.1 Gfo/Idh/MocA family oxidoreductase [Bacillus sp. WMMC1349]
MSLRIGIIGMGVISKFYVFALQNKLNNPLLTAVCDLNAERLKNFNDSEVWCFSHYHDLLAREDIDAVIVNVPNDKHFEICRDALKAGKHVCCEKPLTLTMEEAEELVAISREMNVTLFTAFHRRYNLHFVQALEKLTSREEIAAVHASYLELIEEHAGEDKWYLQPERCGGGCVADNGPNVFDTLSFFLGKMRVQAANIIRDEHHVDIKAYIQLITNSDIKVHVELDWGYLHGEKKDVLIMLKNGQKIYVDMLEGFPEFKSSLYHEYEQILLDFKRQIELGNCHGEAGLDAVRLVQETYETENLKI